MATYGFKCKECGKNLRVDPSKPSDYCPFCGEIIQYELVQLYDDPENDGEKLLQEIPKPSPELKFEKQKHHDRMFVIKTIIWIAVLWVAFRIIKWVTAVIFLLM